MPIDITNRLLRAGTDHAELQALLGSLGDSTSKDGVVDYGDLIRTYFDKDGETIVKAEWIDDRGIGLFDHIEARFREAFDEEASADVASTHIFTSRPITEVTKLANEIQILPLPHGAVSPPTWCTRWPALVEFLSPSSSDDYLAHFRRQKRRVQVLEFLQICAGPYVWRESSSDHLWVWAAEAIKTRSPSEWRQSGFAVFEHWQKDKIGFSVYSSRTENDAQQSTTFQFPDDLSASWRSWTALSDNHKKNFHIASHWYDLAQKNWSISFTLAFSALMVAIDVLLPDVATTPCELCKRPQGPGLNARYRDFLNTYCPGIPHHIIREFANRRSKYVHGGGLMMHDEPRSFGLQPALQFDRSLVDAMFEVCRVALKNWMKANAALRDGDDSPNAAGGNLQA